MSNKDFQNGFALGLASGAAAEAINEIETMYKFNIEELSNISILGSSIKVLDHYTNSKTLSDGKCVLTINYTIWTALQDPSTGAITKLIDIPAQYDNYKEILGNSFNNYYDYQESYFYNENFFGTIYMSFSEIGKILLNGNYCIDAQSRITSNSTTGMGYKIIGLINNLEITFASEAIKDAVMAEFISPVLSTTTDIAMLYKKPATVVNCKYIGG